MTYLFTLLIILTLGGEAKGKTEKEGAKLDHGVIA
jgi:hypothetical protein